MADEKHNDDDEQELVLERSAFFAADDLYDLDFEAEVSLLNRIWNFIFGILALFDLLGAMARTESSSFEAKEYVMFVGIASVDKLITMITFWLRRNSTNLSNLFSLLWFFDAFVSAYQRRERELKELERQYFLEEETAAGKAKKENIQQARKSFLRSTLFFQILLLPAGFFVACYSMYNRLQRPDLIDEVIEVVHVTDGDDVPNECEVFTTDSSLSLIFAIVKHMYIDLAIRAARFKILGENYALAQAKMHAPRVLKSILRHPFTFKQRFRRTLLVVRWAKYLGPLIGKSNMLRVNVFDLLKKRKQHKQATLAKRVREMFRKRLSADELREYSAICIQKTFRAHVQRKKTKALNYLRGRKENLAALKVQASFRNALKRARLRIEAKKLKLEMLREKDKRSRRKDNDEEMTDSERYRMYDLERELKEKANDYINNKLLLRPNTRFAVAWKILFIVAVCVEMLTLAIKPLLLKIKKKRKTKPLDIAEAIQDYLSPLPVSQLRECIVEDRHLSFQKPMKSLRILLENLHILKLPDKGPTPWYCNPRYALIQAIYIKSLHAFVPIFLFLIGVICYMDVFVIFFTGTYDPETGMLKPKPFFQRWIVPGLCLQLLLNPWMEETSIFVSNALKALVHHGPVRVLRWTVALFFPLTKLFVREMKNIWTAIVAEQNERFSLDHDDYLVEDLW